MSEIDIIKLNWYRKSGVKLLRSCKFSEFRGDKEYINEEYAFKFRVLNKKALKKFLEYIEQQCVEGIDVGLPVYFDKIKFDGNLHEFDYLHFLSYSHRDEQIKRTKEIVIRFCKVAKSLGKSVFFQRRIAWKIWKDKEWYSVYGRFACGIN
uniref:Uncharacterized protein n=1 Tax=viral metagenome TaxID=1070528 RepID=A0A6M3KVQ6_9ZZZZ